VRLSLIVEKASDFNRGSPFSLEALILLVQLETGMIRLIICSFRAGATLPGIPDETPDCTHHSHHYRLDVGADTLALSYTTCCAWLYWYIRSSRCMRSTVNLHADS